MYTFIGIYLFLRGINLYVHDNFHNVFSGLFMCFKELESIIKSLYYCGLIHPSRAVTHALVIDETADNWQLSSPTSNTEFGNRLFDKG